jgi:hypothetical protein
LGRSHAPEGLTVGLQQSSPWCPTFMLGTETMHKDAKVPAQ